MSSQPMPVGYPLWIVWARPDGSLERPALALALRDDPIGHAAYLVADGREVPMTAVLLATPESTSANAGYQSLADERREAGRRVPVMALPTEPPPTHDVPTTLRFPAIETR